jgi:hypothetical protein
MVVINSISRLAKVTVDGLAKHDLGHLDIYLDGLRSLRFEIV